MVQDFHPIKAWTHYTFPGRKGRYNKMRWHWRHFNAVGYDAKTGDSSNILLFEGKTFADDVCGEYGNDDYLLGCDIDHDDPEVRENLLHWGKWFIETTGFDGLRLDAVKHISVGFYKEWLASLRSHFDDRFIFTVGEYWSGNLDELKHYLAESEEAVSLFDVPLHYNFHKASEEGKGYALPDIFNGTLVNDNPMKAVTFVENHDTERFQSLESPVQEWFKPLAYALILLREAGYPLRLPPRLLRREVQRGRYRSGNRLAPFLIDRFMQARQAYGFGEQVDYFDHPNCIGWVRLGNDEHPGAMAVVMSNSENSFKEMDVRRPNAAFVDVTGHIEDEITTGDEGRAIFPCQSGQSVGLGAEIGAIRGGLFCKRQTALLLTL